MAKFKKKPIVIEAFQWTGDHNQTEDPEWIVDAIKRGDVAFTEEDAPFGMLIETKEGVMKASPGDYVIQGVACEIYPCKPDIFAATYDPVE